MSEAIAQVATEQAQGGGINIMGLIMLALLGLIGYVIWRAFRNKNDTAAKENKYKVALDLMREQALKASDDHYFTSWFRPGKNAPVMKQFYWDEMQKIRQEPLIGPISRYMGHYEDSRGNIIIAVCTDKEYFVFPVVEVMMIPRDLVHIQDDSFIVNCVGMDRKSPHMPYWPVIKNKSGQIVKGDFFLIDSFFKEYVSTQVIEEHTQLFMENMEKTTKYNPGVNFRRKTRGTDGGI